MTIVYLVGQVPGRPIPPAEGSQNQRGEEEGAGALPQRILPGTAFLLETYALLPLKNLQLRNHFVGFIEGDNYDSPTKGGGVRLYFFFKIKTSYR